MKSVYKKLVSFQDAIRLAKETIKPVVGTEKISITAGSGRILANSVFAPRDNPPFNRSTMDGYAARSQDLAGSSEAEPVLLDVVGESFIGQPRIRMEGEKCCFRISTGAIIPVGADAVARVEDTEDLGNGKVRIFDAVPKGGNIAEAGSDISSQELLSLPGKEIDTNDIAVMASLGISEIEVFRKLKISVISTGNELISHDQPYREGSISDANGIALCNELNQFKFINATYAGIVKDNYDEIKNSIEENLAASDIVILSGGSSAGESDLVYRIIDEMVPGMVFHGVLVKPGLPTVLGRSGEKAVIGLPGFPVSSLMIFRSIFLEAIISAGKLDRKPATLKGTLAVNLRLEMGKQNLVPVTISQGTRPRVYPVTGLSGSISRFISTAGFISLEGNTKFLDAGTEVDVIRWSHAFDDRRPAISGSMYRGVPLGGQSQFMPNLRFYRMGTRDSLKSLKNGDSVVSTFLFTEGYKIGDYLEKELGSGKYYLFSGKALEVGVECRESFRSLDEALTAIANGATLSGPAIRFLENIVSDEPALERLVNAAKDNISSYSPMWISCSSDKAPDEKSDIRISLKDNSGKSARTWIEAFRIAPAFVTLQRDFLENVPELKGKIRLLNP